MLSIYTYYCNPSHYFRQTTVLKEYSNKKLLNDNKKVSFWIDMTVFISSHILRTLQYITVLYIIVLIMPNIKEKYYKCSFSLYGISTFKSFCTSYYYLKLNAIHRKQIDKAILSNFSCFPSSGQHSVFRSTPPLKLGSSQFLFDIFRKRPHQLDPISEKEETGKTDQDSRKIWD